MDFAPGADVGHVAEGDAPWVERRDGYVRVLHADVGRGLWSVAFRWRPGQAIDRHRHTGRVFAWTTSGCWRYREYGVGYRAGSYVFESAGSVHTLEVPEDNTELTEVVFVIEGANLILDEHDNIIRVRDAGSMAADYERLCTEQGHPPPRTLGRV